MDKFSIGDKVTPIKGSHKGDVGVVERVLFAPNMKNEYKISFATKPYYMTLYESSLEKAPDDEVFEEAGETEYLFEMANIHPKDTGLKTSIHAMYNGKAEGLPHGPRVKVVTLQHGRLPIQLTPEVKLAVNKSLKKEDKEIVDAATSYISSNLQLFLDHWDGKITDFELISSLRQIQ